MLAVEFLEGVVGQHGGRGAFSNSQHEGVPAADGAGRWRNDFAIEHGLAHLFAFGVIDPVLEGGVDHDDDAGVRVLGGVRAHGLVELLEARERSSFGGQVRPVHHNVVRFSQWHDATDRPAPTDAGRRSLWQGWPIRPDSRGGAAAGRAGRRGVGHARTTRLPCFRAPLGATPLRMPRRTARRSVGSASTPQ